MWSTPVLLSVNQTHVQHTNILAMVGFKMAAVIWPCLTRCKVESSENHTPTVIIRVCTPGGWGVYPSGPWLIRPYRVYVIQVSSVCQSQQLIISGNPRYSDAAYCTINIHTQGLRQRGGGGGGDLSPHDFGKGGVSPPSNCRTVFFNGHFSEVLQESVQKTYPLF